MTNSCAVPTCNTGRKTIKEKRSVFKVPSNGELRRKWVNAIPGITHLTPSQFICEKHFHARHIRRKWTKYDMNGRIIAEAMYSRARLDPLAIPSKFDGPSNDNDVAPAAYLSVERNISTEHSYCSLSESPSDGVKGSETHMFMSPPLDEFSSNRPLQNLSMVHLPPSTKLSIMKSSLDVTNDRIEKPTPIQGIQRNECSSKHATTVGFIEDQRVQNRSVEHSAPIVRDCHFRFSEVTFNYTFEGMTDSISIPKPWSVSALSTGEGNVYFSYVLTKKENGDSVPVIGKSVQLSVNKQLRYHVYGRAVDAHGCNLPQVLVDMGSLPQALEKFKNMNLCNGVGSINENYLSSDSAFKDCVDRWHGKKCTLISKRKRCDQCIKMRDAALKRNARFKKTETLKRICKASNPIDQRKLTALRQKSLHERRLRMTAERHVGLLQQCLLEKSATKRASRSYKACKEID